MRTAGLFRAAGAAVVVAALVAPARPALAYVRYKTGGGIGFYWPQACMPFTVYPAEMTDMTPAQVEHAASAAAAVWSAPQVDCTYLLVQVASSIDPTPLAAFDGRNAIVFRRATWCGPTGASGTCTYDPAALALTSDFVSTSTGQIRDADIEVNAMSFLWADVDLDPRAGRQDLQNVLAHEIGHAIGLDHTCFNPTTGVATPLDDMGQPAPACATASDTIRATTMFPSAIPGDVAKRTLEPDDLRAVCGVYPKAADPGVCLPDGGTDAASVDARAGAPTDARAATGGDGPDARAATGGDGPKEQNGSGGGCGCALGGSAGAGATYALLMGMLFALRRRPSPRASPRPSPRTRRGDETV